MIGATVELGISKVSFGFFLFLTKIQASGPKRNGLVENISEEKARFGIYAPTWMKKTLIYQFHFHQIKQLDKWIFFPFSRFRVVQRLEAPR